MENKINILQASIKQSQRKNLDLQKRYPNNTRGEIPIKQACTSDCCHSIKSVVNPNKNIFKSIFFYIRQNVMTVRQSNRDGKRRARTKRGKVQKSNNSVIKRPRER